MSRLAKKPIKLVPGTTVAQDGDVLTLKGPKGEKKLPINPNVKIKIDGDNIWVELASDGAIKTHVGTAWSLIRNSIEGISAGFIKNLDIEGVGYKAAIDGKEVLLSVGYVNPIRVKIPDGITIEVEKNTAIKISGSDKELVGLVAANIRALKKPEPYKGKGIRYRGEVIRRKVGKKAGATTGAA